MHYRVTQTMDEAELLAFIRANRTFDASIEHVNLDELAGPATPIEAAPKSRQKRGSRVNEAILNRLKSGPALIPALKAALVDAGMAPGSLSTGLAALQKEGKIRRIEDGAYELAA